MAGKESLSKGASVLSVCSASPAQTPVWPSEVLPCAARDLRVRVARDYSTLTHGHPHSESVLFIPSAQPLWSVVCTGDQNRDWPKAVGMTASGISFLPPIIPKAHEDLLSRSGRQHLLVSTGPQASPLSCTLLGKPRLVMQSRTPNLHLGIWKKYILMTKHWISCFVGKFWDKLLLITVHGSSAVTTLQTV